MTLHERYNSEQRHIYIDAMIDVCVIVLNTQGRNAVVALLDQMLASEKLTSSEYETLMEGYGE